MPIVFPLVATSFADLLLCQSFRWTLSRFVESSGTALGQVITNEIAAPKWRAELELISLRHADAAKLQALIEAIGVAGTFYLHNPAHPGPRLDLAGTVLGGASVTIGTVGATNKTLALVGLPAGYVLSVGDMLSFSFGSNPTRRALHRVVEAATANGSGATGNFEVRPFLKAGVSDGLAVTLVKPSAKMMIEPGSFEPGTAGRVFTRGMAFTAIEVR